MFIPVFPEVDYLKRIFMRRFLKTLLIIGLVIVAFTSPLLLIPIGVGAAALSVGNRVLARKAGFDPDEGRVGIFKSLRQLLVNSIDRKLEQSRRSREYSSQGFDVTALPVDMSLDYGNARQASFTCAGISGLVTAKSTDALFGLVKYSFPIHNLETADMLQAKAASMGNGARVYRNEAGEYMVEATDARSINILAKAAYPMTRVEAERQVDIVRQYRVDGCSSEAEAVKKLQTLRESGEVVRPDNFYQSVNIVIDGNQRVVSDGSVFAMNPSSLPAGTFIVNEVERQSIDIYANIPYNLNRSEVPGYIDSFGRSPVDAKEKVETIYSSATPLDVSRTMKVGDRDIEVVHYGTGLDAGTRIYLEVKDEAQLQDLVRTGKIYEGTNVSLGARPALDNGLCVELEATPGILGKMYPKDGPSLSGSIMVSESDAKWSVLMDSLRRQGSVSLDVREDVVLKDAKVNGTDFSLVADRYSNSRLPKLDIRGLSDWSDDVSRLGDIQVKVDSDSRGVTVSGRVDGKSVEHDTVYLTPAQMKSLESREGVSMAEKVDLFLQMGAGSDSSVSAFKSYPSFGDSSIANPVVDYAKGKEPRTVGKVNDDYNKNNANKKQRKITNKQ